MIKKSQQCITNVGLKIDRISMDIKYLYSVDNLHTLPTSVHYVLIQLVTFKPCQQACIVHYHKELILCQINLGNSMESASSLTWDWPCISAVSEAGNHSISVIDLRHQTTQRQFSVKQNNLNGRSLMRNLTSSNIQLSKLGSDQWLD